VLGVLVAGSPLVVAPHAAQGQAASSDAVPTSFVGGSPLTLTNDASWSWFEGPRALLDACELQVGSTASGATADGSGRTGDVDVTTLDLTTGTTRVDTLAEGLEPDDHNSPALLELEGGRQLAMFTRHRRDGQLRRAGRAPGVWHWRTHPALVSPVGRLTYSNLSFLADEGVGGTLYDVTRGELTPTVLRSTDRGATWQWVGPLVQNAGQRPYVRYADDGVGRIEVATTDGHPKEVLDGSRLYHGYVEGGVLHASDGTSVGPLGSGPHPSELSLVHAGDAEHRPWVQDVEQSAEGPVIGYSVRDLSAGLDADRRLTYWYGRWTGSSWLTHLVGWAGSNLDDDEHHYVGGLVLDPANPSRMVLSTEVHPDTGEPLVSTADGQVHHELFEGTTPDGGMSWTFTAITEDSTVDNIRPEVTDHVAGRQALVWMAGRYDGWLDHATAARAIVVGDGDGTWCPGPAYEPGPNPVSGDFDGDGLLDHLHYVPGGSPDTVFWGDGDRTVVRVDGTYTPIPMRRSEQRDREVIIWSDPTGRSYLWRADDDHVFTSTPYAPHPGATPVVGDFNGDGADDVVHYRPGAGADRLALSVPGGYVSRATKISGRYQPLAGDLDADGDEDVIWYAPGSAVDYIWSFSPTGAHQSRATTVVGSYRPSIGDRDGDGTADVYWQRPDGSGYLWSFVPGQPGAFTSSFVP
jgi:hypothetical protein